MKFPFNGEEYYIDDFLASNLNSIAYNLPKDWDMVILITGDRSVRVGKSVLAMTVGAYLNYRINQALVRKRLKSIPFTLNDCYFDNKVMLEKAFDKPELSINWYDEGREGLAATKAMKSFQQDLMDWFAECGQKNHCYIIVAPDFFELKEQMSVARSELLLNVYRKEEPVTVRGESLVKFTRGQFEFFNRQRKATLYDRSRSSKRKSYGLVKANFIGRFVDQYPLNKEEYKAKKKEALARFKERHTEEKKEKVSSKYINLCQAIKYLTDNTDFTLKQVSEELGMASDYLSKSFSKIPDFAETYQNRGVPGMSKPLSPIIKDKLIKERKFELD